MYPGRATSAAGAAVWTGVAAALVKTPSGLGSLSLAWDADTNPYTAGYRISYGTATGVYTNTVDVGLVTSYAITNLPILDGFGVAITYYAIVQSIDVDGYLLGSPTSEVSGPAVP